MKSRMTNSELKSYLNKKFKEKKFLDSLYIELAEIVADANIIKNLSADELCDMIIDHKLLDKLIKGDDIPGENPYGRNDTEESDDNTKNNRNGLESEDNQVFLKIFLEEITGLSINTTDKDFLKQELRICISFNGERVLTDSSPLNEKIKYLEVTFLHLF